MTDPTRWERTKRLLDRLLDLPAAEREPYLREATADDPSLYDEVMALARTAEPEIDALEHPAALYLDPEQEEMERLAGREGERVGPYRLGRLLGQGGMGVVYEAERTGDVGGSVAIKLIKGGMDSALVARRFHRERRILARLTHPNIAHFIDGGVTDDDRPYFVMEHVEGTPIDTFCDRVEMGVDGRIRLFLQVLEAVGFAHRNLVVHRDLKPSNILVREDGAVKLLDFGVAKVLGEPDAGDATLTRFGGRVLTPSYSSPEQIRGEPVSTSTDLYSLGVVLYELLAGRRPFDLDRASMAEVERVVSHEEPTRPSQAAQRTMPGSTLARRRLTPDLDAILLKALRKEPDRRYTNAEAFHDDLCRYLDRRPVAARRGTVPYRLERFLRRHRAGVVAASIVGLVLVAASIWGGRQMAEVRRQSALAQQRVADVRALVNTLLFEIHDEVAALPGSTGARKLILDRAHERLAAVTDSLPDDPALLMELAEAYRRLGEVEGRPTGPSLGDLTAARGSFMEGLALAERAVALDSTHYGRLRALGLLHERLAGTLAFVGEVEAGVDHSTRAQSIYERIATAFPDSTRHQLTAVIGRINLSDFQGHPSFPNLGRVEDAEAGYREAQRRLDAPPLRADSSYGVVRYRGLVDERLARMLRVRGSLEESRAQYRASLATRERLHAAYPTDDDAWRDVGVTWQNLCSVGQGLGEADAAIADCDRALEVYASRFQADSLNAQTLSDLASVHDSYQELHIARGDTARALEHLAEMITWADRRLARDPNSLPARRTRLDALLTRGLIVARRGSGVPELASTLALADALDDEGHLPPEDQARVAELRRLAME
ncbi:serine/threonine-protein kinase [Gaopeijia maritima]|uniref:serine/threonine-protein kinase n=1 Tax=Gaopeijia maritima TaxID=3119007 RepID=UPI00328154F5